jgi:hypothetical protein
MIPKLLDFTTSPVAKVRALALASINTFIPLKPQALLVALDPFLPGCFNWPMIRATMSGGMFVDPSFNWLTRDRTRLHRIWKDWLTTWLRSSEVRTIQSSLDAAEFWLCVGEHDKLRLTLTPYLGKIVPVLLESMVYSEEDVLRLERGVSMKTKKTGPRT